MRRQTLDAHKTNRREQGLSRRRGRAGLVILTAASCGVAPDAFAQLAGGGYGPGFVGSSGGDLRSSVESLLPGATRVNTGLAWTYGGDIEVDIGATDSAGGTFNNGRGSEWQFFSLISPDFFLNGDTPRLKVALSYSPRLAIYPQTSGQTFLAHTFNGSATYTVLPDWLYFDVRAVGGISSRFGGEPLTTNAFISNNEAVQTASFSVSPYLLHTFGGWGTLTAGYAYARTFQSGNSANDGLFNNGFGTFGSGSLVNNANTTAGFGTTGDLATHTEYAQFVTGENLGRIKENSASVSANQNEGSSFYSGSSTFAATNTLSYAVNRWLSVLGTVGYQEYRYPRGGYNLSEPTWAVGVTITPNADSTLTVQYGRTAGANTVLASGSYSPTARTRVYGSYTVGIQTGLGARQNLLGSTVVGPGGLLLDRTTGTPVLASSLLASQYTLSRVKTLTVGGLLLLNRDTFSASVTHDDVTQLIGSTDVFGISTGPGTNTSDTYATLSWQHDLNPTTKLYSSISYGTSTTGVYFGNPGGSQDTFQLYTGLTHNFTETLSGTASFSHAERYGGAIRNLPTTFGGSASQNVVLVGLRKSF